MGSSVEELSCLPEREVFFHPYCACSSIGFLFFNTGQTTPWTLAHSFVACLEGILVEDLGGDSPLLGSFCDGW